MKTPGSVATVEHKEHKARAYERWRAAEAEGRAARSFDESFDGRSAFVQGQPARNRFYRCDYKELNTAIREQHQSAIKEGVTSQKLDLARFKNEASPFLNRFAG